MKDDRLEKQFDEYFKGANTPDNITDDAKKFVKREKRFLPTFVKFASVAASFVLFIALALTIALNGNFNKKDDFTDLGTPAPSQPDSSPAPSFALYTDEDLRTENTSAYSLTSLDSSLKFIQSLAVSSNSDVKTCSAGYIDGKLALVKADVSLINGLNRDEAEIYVEFTEKYSVYGKLYEYLDGTEGNYRGMEYYLISQTGENGEPEFKLHTARGNVKYYFYIRSTNPQAYINYLELIKF